MKKICLLFISALIISAYTSNAQSYTISTIAGNGPTGYLIGGYSGDGGPADSAELNTPYGLTLDKYGNIYIADSYNYCVRKINTAGIISTFAGKDSSGNSGDGGLATAAKMQEPTGVAVDDSGNVYIADDGNGNNCIRKVNTKGIISTFAGGGKITGDGIAATSATLYNPFGVKADHLGNIYIADGNHNKIRKVNTNGIISTIAGIGTAGYSGDNGPATAAALNSPHTLIIGDSGSIYIADEFNQRIRKVNSAGIISTIAGKDTAGYSGDGGFAISAKLNYPCNMILDSLGNMYIADEMNAVVRKVNKSGIISTIAGNGICGYSGDGGPATAAELCNLTGLFMDASGSIYIVDVNNNRIRKLIPKSTEGINELSHNTSTKVYPNPSNGLFTFELSKASTNAKIEIYNVLGEKVASSNSSKGGASSWSIDLSSQPSGIYFYRMFAQRGSLIDQGKLIKE